MEIIDFQEYKINKIIKNINKLDQEQIKDLLAVLLSDYSSNSAIPIVKLSKRFGIKVYKRNLPLEIGAKLSINKSLEKTHGSNIIIEVNQNHHLHIQRFAAARELAYYLFNIQARKTITSKTIFEETYYIEEEGDKYKELAISILMPDSSFCENFLSASKTRD